MMRYAIWKSVERLSLISVTAYCAYRLFDDLWAAALVVTICALVDDFVAGTRQTIRDSR